MFISIEPRIAGAANTKAQGVNFLSDTEFLGASMPGPAALKD